ncbi:Acyltransferase family protein [Vibrio chagasii]|nr:Acyltransferase family protein [Vibrio chagasii]
MIKRFDALDAFRGLAALMVAIYHLKVIGVVSELTIVKNSSLFVEFFFVLSGFVIAYSYGDRIKSYKQFKDFSIKRFARVWPLHFFMMVLFIPFVIANLTLGIDLGERFSLYSFLSSFFLVQSFTMVSDSWNVTAWSISTEFYTYLIFGLLCLMPNFHRKPYTSILIVIVSFTFLSLKLDINNSMFRCLASFFLGNLAFRYYLSFKVKPWMEWASIILLIFTLSYYQGRELLFVMPFFFFVTVIVFAHESGVVSKALKMKYFQVLGVLSYSIYLTHAWFISGIKAISIMSEKVINYKFINTIDGVRLIDFGFGFNDFIFIPFLLVVIGFSFFTHRFVELKAQKIINKAYLKKTPAYAL